MRGGEFRAAVGEVSLQHEVEQSEFAWRSSRSTGTMPGSITPCSTNPFSEKERQDAGQR